MTDDKRAPNKLEEAERAMLIDEINAWVTARIAEGRRADLVASALLWSAAAQFATAKDASGRPAATRRAVKDLFERYWLTIKSVTEKN